MGEKQQPSLCCLQETQLRAKHTHRLEVKGQKKTSHANGDEKKGGRLTSGRIDFKINTVTRHRKTVHKNKDVNPRRE